MKTLILILMILFPSFYAAAQTDNDAVLYERKTQLEQMITERIRAKIATTLDKALFEVSVEVSLLKVTPNNNPLVAETQPNPVPTVSKLPDFGVDLIESKKIIDKYEKEVTQLREQIKQTSLSKLPESSSFQIKSIRVLVGLSSTLPEAFTGQMKQWLSKQLRTEFGTLATGEVSKMTAKPEAKPEEKKLDPSKTPLDHLKDLQFLLGFILVFVAVILAVILSKMILSKDTQEIHKLKAQVTAAQPSVPTNVTAPELSEKKAEPLDVSDQQLQLSFKKYEELVIKVSALFNPESDQFLIEAWLENGVEGAIKLTLYIDTLLTPLANKQIQDAEGIFRKIKIPSNSFTSVEEAMKIVKNYTPELKLSKLEEVYWDLLSVKTLGLQVVKKPFSYLNKMPSNDLQKFLVSQDPKVRGMVLLTASANVRSEVFSGLDIQQKKNFLMDTLSLKDVSVREIQTINELFKTQLSLKADVDQRISTWEVFPKLIADMSVIDEIIILNEINQKLPDSIDAIKKQTPVLAFIPQWNPRAIERLFAIASSEEIKSLLRIRPDWTELVLSKCPDLVKTIITDDLKQADNFSQEEKEKHLKSLKTKLIGLIANGETSLQRLYLDTEVKRAA